MNLKGAAVLLTGASSGIGWQAALELSRRGARLALAARREDKLKELAALLGTETVVLPWDVADTARAPEIVAAVIEKFGRLDALVNNAGVTANVRFHEQDPAEIEAIDRVNYLGSAALIRAALPSMLDRRQGVILNVASIAGLIGMPYMAAYCASKFALLGLTEALRREYRGTGVEFVSFCPGSVDTPMTSDILKNDALRRATRPKTAEQAARRIADLLEYPRAESIYGEVPGFLVRLMRLLPSWMDGPIAAGVRRLHPLARPERHFV